jgi:hypothetical protein
LNGKVDLAGYPIEIRTGNEDSPDAHMGDMKRLSHPPLVVQGIWQAYALKKSRHNAEMAGLCEILGESKIKRMQRSDPHCHSNIPSVIATITC